MLRRQLLAAAHVVLLAYLPATFAQESFQRFSSKSLTDQPAGATGLLTDRLSAKDLERWKAIERLVFAEDNERQPLHPTLRWLWEWIDTSGHAVYVEIVRVNRTSTCTAGNFSIERFDPQDKRHIAVIKINLPNIDQAYVGPNAARANGFVPFTDLNKEERYAEVLGHEMAHAVHILTSTDRTQKVVEYVENTNDLLLTQYVRRKGEPIAADLKHRLTKRDALLKELEAQAEGMEQIVWKELTASRIRRERNSGADK